MESRPSAELNTNAQMHADAITVEMMGNEREPGAHVFGVKGRHPFCRLPYIKHTLFAYDFMHICGNIIRLCMRLFRRRSKHRAMGAAVLRYDQAHGRFQDRKPKGPGNSNYPVWVFTQAEMDLCDQRLTCVRSNENCDVPKNIFKHLGNQNTHQLMIFAFIYAPFCLGDLSCLPTCRPPYQPAYLPIYLSTNLSSCLPIHLT